jgi:hypothetical protein
MSFWWNKRNGNQRVVYSVSGVGLIFYVVAIVIAVIILSLAGRS